MTAPSRLYERAVLLFLLSFFSTVAAAPALAAAQTGGLIQGQVVDPDQRPVPGATILVDGPSAATRSTLSDARGRFEVATGVNGRHTLRAIAPGLASAGIPLDVVGGETVPVTLVMRLVAVDERLVVSAAQVDQPLTRLPDSATVLDAATLAARQQFTLGQALRSVPGVGLAQSGGPGTLTSMFTRGGESDYTLVLVDGVRANAFGGGFDVSQLLLADVDRIEVVRGPQSALYGADAIGGVVHVVTRAGGLPAVHGLLEAGSREMRRATASTTGRLGTIRWQAGGDYFTDGGFTGRAGNGEAVTNDDARIAQGSVLLGWRGAGGGDVQAALRHIDTDRGTPGPFGSDPAGRFGGVNRTARNLTTRSSVAGRWVQPWFGASSRVRQRTEVDVADFDLESISAFPSTGETRRTHVRTQTDVSPGARLGLSAGAEWLGERGRSTFITAGAAGPVPVERTVAGLFGEARWSPADRLSLTVGARADRIHREAFPGDPTAFTPRPDFPADAVVSVNPKLAASWMLAGTPGTSRVWTRLRGAVGTGIRPPDAFEIAFTDNPGLRPERSRSGELGLAQAWAGGAVQLDVTAFVNAYDDLIIAVGRSFSGVSRWRTDNISNARARGAEVSAAWRPGLAWSLQAAYTFLSTDILAVDGASTAPPPYAVGDPLLRRPRHQGSLDATWTTTRVSAFAQVLARGAALDAEPAFGPTGGLYMNPASAVTNLGASVRVARGVTVQGRILNLLDARYEEVLGFPAPRRTAYVGVSLAAGR